MSSHVIKRSFAKHVVLFYMISPFFYSLNFFSSCLPFLLHSFPVSLSIFVLLYLALVSPYLDQALSRMILGSERIKNILPALVSSIICNTILKCILKGLGMQLSGTVLIRMTVPQNTLTCTCTNNNTY